MFQNVGPSAHSIKTSIFSLMCCVFLINLKCMFYFYKKGKTLQLALEYTHRPGEITSMASEAIALNLVKTEAIPSIMYGPQE